MNHPKYQNPPIQEVICEIILDQGTSWDLAIPGILYEKLKGQFPIREVRVVQEAEIQLSPQGSELKIRESDRAVFITEDRRRLLQIGERLFAINQLPPYPGWEQFKESIKSTYKTLRDITAMTDLRQLSLRYIDRIEIPETRIKIEDYFHFRPHFEGIPEGSSLDTWMGFFAGIQVPFESGRDLLRIQIGKSSSSKTAMTYLLENEYRLARPGAIKPDNVVEWLDSAHERVVEAFESAITDKLRMLFQPQ